MLTSNIIGIVADDLTGANDTALQFFIKGAATDIILDYTIFPKNNSLIDTWAVSTESRNKSPEIAQKRTHDACVFLKNNLGIEYFYKKIDSTLRGNVAVEILSALEATQKDCAIVVPAFIQEGRITIGGYQLVKGIPIERTEAARDPHVPVFESNIINILKKQLPEEDKNAVNLIDFSIVSKGAASIISKLNEFIKTGSRIIVLDAVSVVDIEQIVLAMKKCSYDILPCGSAGLAQVLADNWIEIDKNQDISKTVPKLPKLILSGSATQLSNLQLKKLQLDEEIQNTYFVNLKTDDILDGITPDITERILANLVKTNIVGVYLEEMEKELEDIDSKANERLIDEGITREELAHKITDYLSQLAYIIKKQRDFILITVGGETSFKCTEMLGCKHFQVIDAILPAIPLCLAGNSQYVVTKSGNLGNATTLVEIIKYFERHE